MLLIRQHSPTEPHHHGRKCSICRRLWEILDTDTDLGGYASENMASSGIIRLLSFSVAVGHE